MTSSFSVGLDFGTTNSVLAQVLDDQVSLVEFPVHGASQKIFRSALTFLPPVPPDPTLRVEAGPFAIEAYLDAPADCRFLQSFKTYAASPHFQNTSIFGRPFGFADLLRSFLSRLFERAAGQMDRQPERLVIGRPVHFAGTDPSETLALERYRDALQRLGFADPLFVYEPLAAAYHFSRELADRSTVLVADFGGGTSDFSAIRIERSGGRILCRPLAHSGVGIAGDTFDFRLIDHLVSPLLGKGTEYRMFDKSLALPNSIFGSFARWSDLALMQTPKTLRELADYKRRSSDPDALARLISILENGLSYSLYETISAFKAQLSDSEQVEMQFDTLDGSLDLSATRRQFEQWIAPDLAKIMTSVDDCLQKSSLAPEAVDFVFLTGGSSAIPVLRQRFEERFGSAKVISGEKLTSIAAGLARIGDEFEPGAWEAEAA